MIDRETVQKIDLLDVECLLNALKTIRSIGYNTPHNKAADGVLACIRMAESAITDYEIEEKRKV